MKGHSHMQVFKMTLQHLTCYLLIMPNVSIQKQVSCLTGCLVDIEDFFVWLNSDGMQELSGEHVPVNKPQ